MCRDRCDATRRRGIRQSAPRGHDGYSGRRRDTQSTRRSASPASRARALRGLNEREIRETSRAALRGGLFPDLSSVQAGPAERPAARDACSTRDPPGRSPRSVIVSALADSPASSAKSVVSTVEGTRLRAGRTEVSLIDPNVPGSTARCPRRPFDARSGWTFGEIRPLRPRRFVGVLGEIRRGYCRRNPAACRRTEVSLIDPGVPQ
jgi:hypothetical protein